MTTKKLAGAGAAAVGAATAVTALLIGSATAVADDARPDSAYAIATKGLVPIPPTPFVESEDGEPVRKELIGLGSVRGAEDAGLSAGLLTAEAEAHAAQASVADIDIRGVLSGDLVRTWCEDGEGGLDLVRGSFMGQELPAAPVPNQEIDGSPLLELVLNDQTENEDGTLTVTGVTLEVLPGAGTADLGEQLDPREQAALPALGELVGTELPANLTTVGQVAERLGQLPAAGSGDALLTVVIGSATCSAEDDKDDHDDDGTPDAPKPDVVKSDLPVTG